MKFGGSHRKRTWPKLTRLKAVKFRDRLVAVFSERCDGYYSAGPSRRESGGESIPRGIAAFLSGEFKMGEHYWNRTRNGAQNL